MLLDLLPKLGVLLDADLLVGVELVEAAEIHVLGEQRDHVLVEGLPVRVLEVVPRKGDLLVSVATFDMPYSFFLVKLRTRGGVGSSCVLCFKYSLLAALVDVALDDCEGTGVLVILHHEPESKMSALYNPIVMGE